MTVTYLKKAAKTPATGTEETRKIVSDMLDAIEKGARPKPCAMAKSWMDMKARRLSVPTKLPVPVKWSLKR